MIDKPISIYAHQKFEWMDNLRGVAALFICIHHWFVHLYKDTGIELFDKFINLFTVASGSIVQVFFVLSGAGLMISYSRKCPTWWEWTTNRFLKILLPYWIVVCFTYFITQTLHHINPDCFVQSFSLKDFSIYILLSQNFFQLSSLMISSLWYVPNIVGLYFTFPLIVKLKDKFGLFPLFVSSFLISVGSISLVILNGGFPGNHSSIFLFFIFLFVLGIGLSQKIIQNPGFMNSISSCKAAIVGLSMYLISWAMQHFHPYGNYYNNAFTVLGLIPVSFFLFRFIVNSYILIQLRKISKCSYYFYLIHLPIIIYIIKPFSYRFTNQLLYQTYFFLGSIFFLFFIYIVSNSLTIITNHITALIKCKFNVL